MEWFRSYLSARTQYVILKEIHSDLMYIWWGVHQGSDLGPLLFMIYTNDLSISIKNSKCILFADDTTKYYLAKILPIYTTKLTLILQQQLTGSKKLTLNINKTNYATFSGSIDAHSMSLSLHIGNEYISKVTHFRRYY